MGVLLYMGESYSIDGRKSDELRILIRNCEGRKLLGRLRHRWKDKIKVELQERL
jgi:hypothetical protein